MEAKKITYILAPFISGFALGAGIISLIISSYYIGYSIFNEEAMPKTLFYILTGISCTYIGIKSKRETLNNE